MKIVGINAGNFGSTGGIMRGVAQAARMQGHEAFISCADSRSSRQNPEEGQIFIGGRIERNLSLLFCKMFGLHGFGNLLGTWRFLRRLDAIRPDVLHLHNLHSDYINLPMLFRYIKKHHIKTVWTLHDCWAFTAYCPHFDMAKCNRWKTGCYHCPQYREYPESKVDLSKKMYALKKRWFMGVEDLTVVAPSKWLFGLIQESFLREYPVKVIYNGIDLDVFKPTEGDFKKRYQIEDKKMVLGVASPWSDRKGLDVFVALSKLLDDDYQIVLAGLTKEQIAALPEGIIGIEKSQNQRELAEIYTAADVFANPTREEVLGLVNIEALACGTPVVTFDTGGAPECIDEHCGIVIKQKDAEHLKEGICFVCEEKPFSKEACRKRAEHFEKNEKFQEYIKLY